MSDGQLIRCECSHCKSVYPLTADACPNCGAPNSIKTVAIVNGSVYFIDEDRVNMRDLCAAKPGGIVRVYGNPHDAVMVLAPTDLPS